MSLTLAATGRYYLTMRILVKTKRYEFTAGHDDDRDGYGSGYIVTLPHQCDDWQITGTDRYLELVDKDTAVKQLEEFIAEAVEALDAIRSDCSWSDRVTVNEARYHCGA